VGRSRKPKPPVDPRHQQLIERQRKMEQLRSEIEDSDYFEDEDRVDAG
jgi:hypothetical protein